ncbi:MAG: hypothetical protein HY817_03430 [Candidatus Abawacabacteria bacterium]|nr:hypothetical protein [Candidatus Abawacabacteria bacterium]
MKISLATFHNSSANIHIIGAVAVEGSVIARFLFSLGAKNVTLHDFCEKKEFPKRFRTFHTGVQDSIDLWQKMRSLPYPIHFKDSYLEGIEQAELLFINQAWYRYAFNFPKLGDIVNAGAIPVSSMIDLYLQLFPGKTIGITGTHGKTTVTRLMAHVLKTANKKVYTSGNDRHSEQILEKITQGTIGAEDILVLEISNRQLKQSLEKSPTIAVITNVYPNHLDEHADFADYRATKMRIAEKQTKQDLLIVGNNDAVLADWAQEKQALVITTEKIDYIKSTFTLPDTLVGEHNLTNVAIVYQIAKSLEINDSVFQNALTLFPGVEKRQESIFKTEQVKVINDSIATTPTATTMAVRTFAKEPLFLIMGGDDKNIPQTSWDELVKTIQALTNIQVAILPGTIRAKLAHLSAQLVPTLEDALAAAQTFLSQQKSPTTILVSPGGEAFYTKFLAGKSLEKLAQDYFSSSTTLNLG